MNYELRHWIEKFLTGRSIHVVVNEISSKCWYNTQRFCSVINSISSHTNELVSASSISIYSFLGNSKLRLKRSEINRVALGALLPFPSKKRLMDNLQPTHCKIFSSEQYSLSVGNQTESTEK